MSTSNFRLGNRIKLARARAGLTQEELAEKLGVSSRYIVTKYETGEREPDFEMLRAIARETSTSMAYLLGETDDPDPIIPLAPNVGQTVELLIQQLDSLGLEAAKMDSALAPLYIRGAATEPLLAALGVDAPNVMSLSNLLVKLSEAAEDLSHRLTTKHRALPNEAIDARYEPLRKEVREVTQHIAEWMKSVSDQLERLLEVHYDLRGASRRTAEITAAKKHAQNWLEKLERLERQEQERP